MESVDVPEYFICPISLQIMKDPVTATTGITYDRESIEHWLYEGHNSICPVTKQLLPRNSDLTPNHTLRRLIQLWCTENAARGIDRIPTPKTSLSKFYVLNLIRDLSTPDLVRKTLKRLKSLALENERNRKYIVEADLPKALMSIITGCRKKGEITGLEEALNILYLIRNLWCETEGVLVENQEIFDSLTWVLECTLHKDDWPIKSNAICVLRTIIDKADSVVAETLKPEFYKTVLSLLRENITQEGINAALKIMLDAFSRGGNRTMMVENGAVFDFIEFELKCQLEKRTTELIFGVLFHLCSTADGRAQLLSHAAGIAVVTRRIMKVSPATDDRAVLILSLISRFSATNGVLQEMLNVGTVEKLCMLIQADTPRYLKEKALEILRAHSEVWMHSPCIDAPVLTRYTR